MILVPESEEEKAKAPKPELLVDVTRVLASDQAQASMLAARAIPEDYVERLDEIQLVVRPF